MTTEIIDQIFQYALQVCPQATLITDGEGRIINANEMFVELCGLNLGELIDQNINDYFPVQEQVSGEGVFELKSLSERIVGEAFNFHVHYFGDPANPAGCIYFISSRDQMITGKLSWREEKLASLGTLAGEIAHDLNNLLTGILGHVSYLRLSLPEDGDHTESVSAIEDAARGAAVMTQRILEFAKGEQSKFAVVDMANIVKSGTNLLRAALPKNIDLLVNGVEKETAIVGDEIALSQVVMNLVVNARDALPEGGNIRISLDSMSLERSPQEVRPKISPGHYAALTISDNGSGIQPAVLERIFEPFFTTKSEHGTGLGLATVLAIVSKHGGGISIHSTVDKGTQFIIFLPLHHEQKEKSESKESEIPRGQEQILIVDDEDTVRTVIQRSLELLGYSVVTASGGEEALELYARPENNFRLVILDMMMPKMAGDEVFEKLRLIDTAAPVLIASGYSSDGRTKKILEGGGLGFIQKPFAVEDLAIEVRRCIEQSSGGRL